MSEVFVETKTERRARLTGSNIPTFYRTPRHLVRGQGGWLLDASGKRYLDCYNNVVHVRHGHPRVVQAIADQAATLNTHTRYMQDSVLDYIERLIATFDHGIAQVIMTCIRSKPIGAGRNMLKIRPPMAIGLPQADILVDTLTDVLAATPVIQ